MARVKLNRRGMDELLNGEVARRATRGPAERVLSAARASAPVDTGEYRDSLRLVEDSTDRLVQRVVATAAHGMVVEARTGNLARALDAAR